MSSAGLPTPEHEEAAEIVLPRAPDSGTVVGIVFAGALVFVMSMISAGAFTSGFYAKEGRDWIGVIAFGVIPLAILAGAARYWLRALRSESRARGRWIPLLVPGFIVVGCAAGIAFVRAAYAAVN